MTPTISARRLPPCMPLQASRISADLAGEERLRAVGINAARDREKLALHIFEQRLKDLSDASRQMIDAVVELRDARAAVQTP